MVILQPILTYDTSSTTALEASDLDLQTLMAHSATGATNGHPNGDTHGRPEAATMWREGHNIIVWDKKSQRHQPFRISMLEPAAHGHIDGNTRVIVSSSPFSIGDDEEEDDHVDGIIDGLSSHGKTHISLTEFDPDAFLSTSLDLALRTHASDDFDTERDMSQSISSTSGSVTPRPPGTMIPVPPSPPAPLEELDDTDDDDMGGTRLTAVRAMGPSGSESIEEVCWMSVGGLGRAGVFEGDWVCVPPHLVYDCLADR